MLCACSGEQFKFEAEDAPQSPESLATRDFSASGFSSRATGDWDSKVDDIQVDEAESTLKEALSLNYEVGLGYLLLIMINFLINCLLCFDSWFVNGLN